MSTTSDWRDKYLDALDEQERQQKQHQQQQELLRRALVRVSLAAEGQDPELDAGLKGLRKHLKQGTGDGLEGLVENLEASVLRFDKGREQRAGRTLEELTNLARGLQAHAGDAAAEVKRFGKRIKLAQDSDLPLLLSQLGELQQQILNADAADQPTGFLDRLLGRSGREEQSEADSAPAPSNPPSSIPGSAAVDERTEPEQPSDSTPQPATQQRGAKQPEDSFTSEASSGEDQFTAITDSVADTGTDTTGVITPGGDGGGDPLLEGQLQTRAEVDLEQQQEAVFQRPVHEPAFSRISDKVFRVLTDLLDRVEPVDCTEQKAADARERLERGLNWYELVPTLEDIRDLVLQAYLLADEEYREHLRHLHGVLESILTGLGGAIEQRTRQQQLEQQFEDTLQHQLGSLGQSLAVATEVNQLKQDINAHLEAIHGALQKKQSGRVADDTQQRLEDLSQQLQEAQAQAEQAQAQLESARQQAVTDALTGLPNREAYNQRVHQEWSRWQRYGNPLTLVVTDIDHFKRINDTYGHQAGDRVLQVLSKAISQRLREVDFMARYGGEEFVILLPETEPQDGLALMDKIRTVIADTPFRFKQDPVKVTLSMGIVWLKQGDTAEKAFARADKLLYQAKEQGRNRCILDS